MSWTRYGTNSSSWTWVLPLLLLGVAPILCVPLPVGGGTSWPLSYTSEWRTVLHLASQTGQERSSADTHVRSSGVLHHSYASEWATGSSWAHEWLILGPGHGHMASPAQGISLVLEAFSSQCSQSFLYLYDGSTARSPTLGVFTGQVANDIKNATRTSFSGALLVVLVCNGPCHLRARYAVSQCSATCSKRGTCIHGACVCQRGWTGPECQQRLCPHHCHSAHDHGHCDKVSGTCRCSQNYSGDGCSFPSAVPAVRPAMHAKHYTLTVSSDIQPRSGHASAVTQLNTSTLLWIFGGHNGEQVLDDLILYNLTSSQWQKVEISGSDRPAGRYHHTLEAIGDYDLYMVGGQLASGEIVSSVWKYQIWERQWTRLEAPSSAPSFLTFPALALHAMCRHNTTLIVFGGYTPTGMLSNAMYTLDSKSKPKWQEVDLDGPTWLDVSQRLRLAGHSAVVHSELQMLIVFGGYTSAHNSLISSHSIFAFHLVSHYWIELPSHESDLPNIKMSRALHSATIFGDYMLVFGGLSVESQCNSTWSLAQAMLYDFNCYRWLSWSQLPARSQSRSATPFLGFGHSASKLGKDRLLVMGGVRSTFLTNLEAFQLPTDIINSSPKPSCHERLHPDDCHSAIQCVWCAVLRYNASSQSFPTLKAGRCVPTAVADSTCYRVASSHLAQCRDLCTTQHHCSDCLKWRSSASEDSNPFCSFCPSPEFMPSCRRATLPRSHCSARCDVPAADPLTSATEVVYKDASGHSDSIRSNASRFTFHSPVSNSSADQIIISTSISMGSVNGSCASVQDQTDCVSGFRPATVRTSVTCARAWLSVGYASKQPEEVGQLSSPLDSCVTVTKSFDVMLNSTHAVLVQLTVEPFPGEVESASADIRVLQPESAERVSGSVNESSQGNSVPPVDGQGHFEVPNNLLSGNPSIGDMSATRPARTAVPFSAMIETGQCVTYRDCLQCTRNTTCGWCSQRAQCQSLSSGDCNSSASPAAGLVRDGWHCLGCGRHDVCAECLNVAGCAWNVKGRCQFAGMMPSATNDTVADRSLCPKSCSAHVDCQQCLATSSSKPCSWCSSTSTCVDLLSLPLTNSYGQCSLALSGDPSLCSNCSARLRCSDCLNQPQAQDKTCGWCLDDDDPSSGRCVSGTYLGPSDNSSCKAFYNSTSWLLEDVDAVLSSTDNQSFSWYYSRCPRVDWCAYGNSCSENATCRNGVDGLLCTCLDGYHGNGTHCTQWCAVSCSAQGHCSGAPLYECACDLGWTGESCSIDCQCNNLSTCVNGPQQCDQCQNSTAGEFCEECAEHTYRLGVGHCRPCQCNGHGDRSLGTCNQTSAECICLAGHTGQHCQLCDDGYFPSPHNASICTKQCFNRLHVTSSELTEFVTTHSQSRTAIHVPKQSHCVLVIVATDQEAANSSTGSDAAELFRQSVQPKRAVELRVESVSLPCANQAVVVYDGLQLMDSSALPASHNSHVIGLLPVQSFARPAQHASTLFYGLSGVLTVYMPVFADSVFGVVVSHRTVSCPTCPSPRQPCLLTESDTVHCSSFHAISAMCVNSSGMCKESSGTCDAQHRSGDASQSMDGKRVEWTYLSQSRLVARGISSSDMASCTASDPCSLETFPPRYGHSAIFATQEADSLLVFGGLGGQGEFLPADLVLVSILNKTWHVVSVKEHHPSAPPALYGHTSMYSDTGGKERFYVFGGITMSNVSSRAMWSWDISSRIWKAISVPFPVKVASRAFHTMTATGGATESSGRLLILGGYYISAREPAQQYVMSCQEVLLFDTVHESWSLQQTSGPAFSVYGHTATFIPVGVDGSVLVIGGHQYLPGHIRDGLNLDGAPPLTLFRLDLNSWKWHYISPALPMNKLPSSLTFHQSALINDDLILVVGGVADNCQEHSMMLLDTQCYEWVSLDTDRLTGKPRATSLAFHTMAQKATGSVLLGGFGSGKAQGDVSELRLPAEASGWCSLVTNTSTCHALRRICSWCSDLETLRCFLVANQSVNNCSTDVSLPARRPCNHKQTCGEFSDCISCVDGPNCEYGVDGQCHDQLPTNGTSVVSSGQFTEPWLTCPVAGGSICNLTAACSACFQSANPDCASVGVVPASPLLSSATFWWCSNTSHDQLAVLKSLSCETNCTRICATPCSAHLTCSACVPAEDASNHGVPCSWSASLQRCMAKDESRVLCPALRHASWYSAGDGQCKVNCSQFTSCHRCSQVDGCGWCAGRGNSSCQRGGLNAPASCMVPADMPFDIRTVSLADTTPSRSLANFSWHYLQCPNIDECADGSHDCVAPSQQCKDLDSFFICQCAPGYFKNPASGNCEPVCSLPCQNGFCVRPDICRCKFAFTGISCSTKCECYGHSNCSSDTAEGRKMCLQCRNNTHGKQCEECDVGYVQRFDSRRQSFSCQTCSLYCHGNSNQCVSLGQKSSKVLRHGSTLCVGCANNTYGTRCDFCKAGYFSPLDVQLGPFSKKCIKCMCNGHGLADCGAVGDECSCQNNTESTACHGSQSRSCYREQCNKCKSLYVGMPTNGSQCYKLLSPDKLEDFYLGYHVTKFFSIPPRYTNVDIRLTVESHQMALDVWVLKSSSELRVEVVDGVQRVFIVNWTEVNTTRNTRESLSKLQLCTRREVSGKVTYSLPPQVYTVDSAMFHKCHFQGELVLRFPHSQHSLRDQKFFLAVRGVYVNPNSTGLEAGADYLHESLVEEYGGQRVTIYYQQDLLQIDLFIFFSCFFSCFFLLLWLAMGLWKMKIMYEERRRHIEAEVTRQRNERRPFAQVRVLVPLCKQQTPESSTAMAPLQSDDLLQKAHPYKQHCLLTHQPLRGGKAWLSTAFIQLPGSATERNFALATALTCEPSATNSSPGPLLRKRGFFSSTTAQLQKPWRRSQQFQYEIGRPENNA